MKKLSIIFILLASICYSQNWDVFNETYRYNYKFDNSDVISNVLFVETSAVTATAAIYSMNTIGVVTGSVLTINKPQFLMKKIVKLLNGNVQLQDTTSITIIPTCTPNQSWVFDNNYNLTATCVSASTLNIFNVVDSVKTIIVNNVDSVVLSKQFGILQFPKLYAQNKYYRLVGIENKATYDQAALFGEKVPNAWDFYNYFIGYKWCYETETTPTTQFSTICYKATETIKTKTITANSYIYNVDRVYTNGPYPMLPGFCSQSSATTAFVNTNLTINGSPTAGILGLSSPDLLENKYYPGLVQSTGNTPPYIYYTIVKFGKDNTGRFYKYIGPSCAAVWKNQNFAATLPNQNEPGGYGPSGSMFAPVCGCTNHMWGVGLGKVSEWSGYCVSGYSRYCIFCSGTVGLADLAEKETTQGFYPNPADARLNFSISKGLIKIFNSLGNLVKEALIENENIIDISKLPEGLYLVEIQSDSFKGVQKLIIRH